MKRRPDPETFPTALAAVVLCLFVVATAIPAFAATSPSVLEERIDLDLVDAAAADILTMFAQMLGAELELDPAVTGTVTITLHNVTARTALTAVCEGLGCRWRVETGEETRLVVEVEDPEVALRKSREASVTVELNKVPAEKAFGAVARINGIRLELDSGVAGEISASLRERKLDEVLDDFCRQIACRWTLTENEDRTILRVVAR
jgi:hypothetical protein